MKNLKIDQFECASNLTKNEMIQIKGGSNEIIPTEVVNVEEIYYDENGIMRVKPHAKF
jgi:hypothetical protein